MTYLSRADLWSLEQYSIERAEFRDQVIKHKKDRKIMLGKHLQLIFEDRLTIRYQIQEMLRIEKIFEPGDIDAELSAYNPLIPDGDNWKCCLMIQYIDVAERSQRLTELVGIEDVIWVQVGDNPASYAIADEDLERAREHKTSAVHFLRFALDSQTILAAKSGAPVKIGAEHANYPCAPLLLSEPVRTALVTDLL